MFSLTIALVLFVLSIIYYYLKSTYFTLHGSIPGIPPQFFFGNLIQLGLLPRREISMPDVLLNLTKKFGDVYQIWLGSMRLIMINSLEDAQYIFAHRTIYDQGDIFTENLRLLNPKGIICLKGAEFKRHATFTGPLFRRGKILIHLDTILDCTDKLLDRWRMNYKSSTEVHCNMIEQSQQLLMNIFGFIAFDYDLQTLDNQPENKPNELTQAFYSLLNTMQMLFSLPLSIARIYLLLNIKVRHARMVINQYLEKMIEHELNATSDMRAERKRTSLIASLVTSLQQDEKFEASKSEEEKKGLSRYEVMCEMLAFLSAGYGTTSTSLAWFIYFMSKKSDVQQKIKDELAPLNGQRFSLEELDSLNYLDCVLRELFRLVSPVLGTARTLVVDDQLPHSGVHLKKGDTVLISFYSLARDSRYWSEKYNLNEFHPERFINDDNDDERKNNLAASMAFGGGHRQCMGQDLARFELKIICARLMQFVTFGDGGSELNAGGYDVTDTNKPRRLGVTVTFD